MFGCAAFSARTKARGTRRRRRTQFVPRHITIVTGGTAYIEGNLLKGTPDSSISILAHDYVCINTTQFLAGANVEDRTDGRQNPDLPQSGDFLDLDDGHSLLQTFNFGLTGTATPSLTKYGTNKAWRLYVSAGPGVRRYRRRQTLTFSTPSGSQRLRRAAAAPAV